MKPKKVLISKFRFDDFVESTLNFLKPQVSDFEAQLLKDLNITDDGGAHPSFSVVWLEGPDNRAHFGPTEGRDGFLDELREGKKLFFPFSSSCVDDEVHNADNSGFSYDDDDERLLSDIDCVGFLLSLNDDSLTIEHAVHFGGSCMSAPCVEVRDCAEFESSMQKYLEQFINN